MSWINELAGTVYPPFVTASKISEKPLGYYFHFYSLRALIIGVPVFIIRYRDDLVKEKQIIQLRNEKLESQSLKMQLEVLRQQVNPHFLFNTLNALRILIKKNPDEAELYTIELAKVYRYLLNYHKDETVSVREELDFVMSYISLLTIRFGNNLKVNVDINESAHKNKIIPLSLQILLENAVKHNTITKEDPLYINIAMKEPKLLAVENNMQLRLFTEIESKFGLHHLNEQYRFLTGKEISIIKTDKSFMVVLPLI